MKTCRSCGEKKEESSFEVKNYGGPKAVDKVHTFPECFECRKKIDDAEVDKMVKDWKAKVDRRIRMRDVPKW